MLEPLNQPIKGFNGDYRWLSNFVPAKIVFEGQVYPSVEHAYVAAKINDPSIYEMLIKASAATAKKLGRGKERKHWGLAKDGYMFEFLIQKYSAEPYMSLLLNTKDAYIEETNWWNDTYWGVCNGVGHNKLGKMIMAIRDELNMIQKE